MSVQSEIDRIEAARDDIAEAIREQDVTVPAGTKLAALADLVRQIVGKVRTVCGKGPDSAGNIALTASDVGAAASSHKHAAADITSGTMPISRGGTGATTAAAARQALGAAGTSTATTSAAGLMSAADKDRLDRIRVWPLNTIVPDAWTQDTDGSYYSRRSAPGMTTDTQIIACTLMARYVGDTAAEQAAATWTYLETDDDDVVLHAPTRPAATFGLVIAALPT